MPLYEYRCAKCDKTIEVIQKFSDAPLSQCPECNSSEITKLLSKTSFQLKGTGWYATDYKSSKKTEPPKTEAPAVKTEEKKAESPKPSTPAQKTDS